MMIVNGRFAIHRRLLMLTLLLWGVCARAAPVLFFSDLESAPVNAFVTVYGANLGATPGTLLVGNTPAKILTWTDTAVEVQLAPGSGRDITGKNAASERSNSLPFTTRAGNIYFVSQSSGDDDNDGKAATPQGDSGPWRSFEPIKKNITPGDIVYVRSGRYSDILDKSYKTVLLLRGKNSGAPGKPIALAAYPGEAPVIGDNGPQGTSRGIVLLQGVTDWTFAKLRITAKGSGIRFGDSKDQAFQRIRIVGNELFDTPSSYGTLSLSHCDGCQVLGNHIHHSGEAGNKLAHLIYYEGNGRGSNLEIGWNLLHDEHGGRCIQIYGHRDDDFLTGVSIHDNVAYNCPYDGILVGRSDAKKKDWIQDAIIFNNVVYNSGYKGDSAGIRIDNEAVSARLYHNTLFHNNSSIWLQRARLAEVKNNLLVLKDRLQKHIRIGTEQKPATSISHNGYVGGESPSAQDAKTFTATRFESSGPLIPGGSTSTATGYAFGIPKMYAAQSNSLVSQLQSFSLAASSPFMGKGTTTNQSAQRGSLAPTTLPPLGIIGWQVNPAPPAKPTRDFKHR
jgi:hypothetical protein